MPIYTSASAKAGALGQRLFVFVKGSADRIKARLRRRKENRLAFNIGTAREVLTNVINITAKGAGKGMSIETYPGMEWRKQKREFRIMPEQEPNPHIVISGMSGYGKSTLLKSMILDIKDAGRSALIFDAHNEHEAMVGAIDGRAINAAYTGISIFELDGMSVAERVAEITNLLKGVYALGYIQATKLSECLWYTYRKLGARSKTDYTIPKVPAMQDLINEISIFIGNARTASERSTLTHLRERILHLNTSTFSSGSISMDELGKGLHSISLAGLRNQEAQVIYIHEILRRLYSNMRGRGKEQQLSLYVIIDEAQFMISSSGSASMIISKLIEEGRKYGVGIIIVTHAASTLDRQIIANASTFISFYAREPTEVNYIGNIFAGGDPNRAYHIKSRLSRMDQHQAIVTTGRTKRQFLIEMKRPPEINERIGPIKDMQTLADKEEILRAAKRPILLEDLTDRFSIVEIQEAEDKRMLDRLELRAKGKKETWIMKHNPSLSIEHEVYVSKISEYLTREGIIHTVIDNGTGPDISAGETAIEFETGKKKQDETIRMIISRLSEYNTVYIIKTRKIISQASK